MMLLPSKLRTLILLVAFAAVRAQAVDTSTAPSYTPVPDAPTAGSTSTVAPISSPSEAVNDLAPSLVDSSSETSPEPEPTDEVWPCDLAEPPDWCEEPPPFWHPEVTATGWDDWGEWNNNGVGGSNEQGFAPSTTAPSPAEQTPIVITTRTPTVIEIRTSVDPSAPNAVGGVETTPVPQPEPAPVSGEPTEEQDSPAQPTIGQDTPQTRDSGKGSIPQGTPPQPTPGQPSPGQPTPGHSAPEQSAPGQPVQGQPVQGQPTPGQPVPVQSTAVPKSNTAVQQHATSGNSLVDVIINQLGNAQPHARPTLALSPSTGGSNQPTSHESQMGSPTETARVEQDVRAGTGAAMSDPTISGVVGTASALDSIAVDNTITVGSATLTLTPGLSTVIGTGSQITLVAIQTDSASRTIITVSSSGTAVTATITNAPATVTIPRTGFEASVTGDAGRGVTTPRPEVTAATTSSRGIANEKDASITHLTRLMLGILGFILA